MASGKGGVKDVSGGVVTTPRKVKKGKEKGA